jgi:tetratricopeptide (TPR) repeat protein
MADSRSCPGCGQPLADNAPRGLCPLCLLRQGLLVSDADATAPPPIFSDLSISFEPASSSVLARIAESIGHVPHVLLRDTDVQTGPDPIVKPSSSEMPGPRDRPDRYQLFGEIARGGMGAVLRGRDVDLGRDLAVKVLLESHRDKPELMKRFVEEAQIGGQLQHPGIVPVYELGAFSDRRPFFTMKLVKGRTLADLLRGRSSPAAELPRFLSIFESIAQTMAYAHVRGVIHRDLKPSNVMVGSFGEVQVMDWGLAKVLPQGGLVADQSASRPEPEVPISVIHTARTGSDADASQAGSVLGTPGYMAPEQARGEVELVDERADVFGLGNALAESRDTLGAIAEYNAAIRIDEGDEPGKVAAHCYLGTVLRLTGDLAGAITAYCEAVRLDTRGRAAMIIHEARAGLGMALAESGDVPGAIAEFHKAIPSEFRFIWAIIMAQHPDRAVATLRRIREQARDDRVIVGRIDRAISQYEQFLKTGVRLPRILRLSLLANNLGEYCYYGHYFGNSAAIWSASFATDPKLAEDMSAQNRYNAACAAAMVAAGNGIDNPPLDEQAKMRWRKQALDWLKSDLAYWSKQARSGTPEAQAETNKTLQHWKADSDLAGIRDEETLKKLPEDQQKACRTLWSEVDQLLKETSKN